MSLLSLVPQPALPNQTPTAPSSSQAPAASPQGESVARCGVCSEVTEHHRKQSELLSAAHDKGATSANKVTGQVPP